jgi:glutamyl-tRNA(Gln) amidotransferase subunit E
LGDVDVAVLEESKRKLTFKYECTSNTCLVEADEEPPHAPNQEAIYIALEIAGLLNAKPVDELTFMRKIVIDGSTTTGFQRTGLIAYDGVVDLSSGEKLEIPTICLEEDAARKIGESDQEITYRLDRLGIPEIEITTAPTLKSPQAAKEAAKKIGEILRATGKVLHGLGTIRQDINISIHGGARCEIKLVQELNAIPKVVELEVDRQLQLIEAKKVLTARGVEENDLTDEYIELTEVFQNTESNLIRNLTSKNGKVLGVRLKGFNGLFEKNLGPELARYVQTRGVKGLLESDELPGYGISTEEVEEIKKRLRIEENDGFVLIAEQDESLIKNALNLVVFRAKLALTGVPNEVRGFKDDNKTVYQRPLPGAARMYPETDVPPIRITQEKFKEILENLPELLDEKQDRYVNEYSIAKEQAKQLISTNNEELFEELVKKVTNGKLVAQTILNTIPELESEKVPVDKLSADILVEIFQELKTGKFAKEAIPDILKIILQEDVNTTTALTKLGIESTDSSEVESIIDSILAEPERQEFIKEKGMAALGPLMGVVMGKLKGKVDGRVISEILRKKLREK